MKRILSAFLLACLLILGSCGSEPADETTKTGQAVETAMEETETEHEKTVKFVSGTTFSGAVRPAVVSDGRQFLDPSPSRGETPESGMKLYAVNSTKAGRLYGIRDQKVGEEPHPVEAEAKPGYRFVSWSDGVTERIRVDTEEGLYTAIFDYDIASMPILVIETENGGEIDSKEEYCNATLSLYGCKEKYVLESVPMEIRGRGNNSWTYPKKSYKFKLEKKENLLGLANGKERVWCLLANQCDMSLQRNRVSFEFCRYMSGLDWSPACTPVEVYLNHEYVGVYLLTEEIKVSGDRVDIADTDPDSLDTGYLVEMSNYAEGDTLFYVYGRSYMVQSDLSEDRRIRQQQLLTIQEYIAEANNTLASGSKEEAEKYIDLESLLAVYLVEETILNLDSQWDSFYMYKDTGGRLTFGPIWDFDLTMGNADDGSDNPCQLFVGNGRGSGNSRDSWFGLAMTQSWFRKMVAEKWAEVYDSFVLMPDFIRDEAGIGKESYERNFQKWPIFGQKQNRETEAVVKLKSFEAHTEYLAGWLETRIAWLDDLFRDPAFVTEGKGLDR